MPGKDGVGQSNGSAAAAARGHRGNRGARLRRVLRYAACASLLCLIALPAATPPGRVAAASVAAPLFPGPARGVPVAVSTVAPALWARSCNMGISSELTHVRGKAIGAGAALTTADCGQAVLYLTGSRGRLHALVGATDESSGGDLTTIRVRVVGADGYTMQDSGTLRLADYAVGRGANAVPIDLNVSGAVAVVVDGGKGSGASLYDVTLSGAAQALGPVTSPRSGLAPGIGAPIAPSGFTYGCNTHAATATEVVTVTQVGIPGARVALGADCGLMTLVLRSATSGTLTLRYGVRDGVAGAGARSEVIVRVLDAGGRVLRKTTGVTFAGAGLRPLWLDLRGGSTVTLTFTEHGGTPVVTGVALVGESYTPASSATYTTLLGAGASGATTALRPSALIYTCNVGVGAADLLVARTPVFSGAYINGADCGLGELLLAPGGHGRFHALFGVPDTATSGNQPVLHVVGLDRNAHPVVGPLAFHAPFGAPGVPVEFSLDRVVILSFSFSGQDSALYDLRLSGTIQAYADPVPPVNPPSALPGGMVVNLHDVAVTCNVAVTTDDTSILGDRILQGWALTMPTCGQADLTLAGTPYPRHRFNALVGIQLGQPPSSLAHVRVSAYNAAGKVSAQFTQTVRYGYGRGQQLHLVLPAGTTKIELQTLDGADVLIYAVALA